MPDFLIKFAVLLALAALPNIGNAVAASIPRFKRRLPASDHWKPSRVTSAPKREREPAAPVAAPATAPTWVRDNPRAATSVAKAPKSNQSAFVNPWPSPTSFWSVSLYTLSIVFTVSADLNVAPVPTILPFSSFSIVPPCLYSVGIL